MSYSANIARIVSKSFSYVSLIINDSCAKSSSFSFALTLDIVSSLYLMYVRTLLANKFVGRISFKLSNDEVVYQGLLSSLYLPPVSYSEKASLNVFAALTRFLNSLLDSTFLTNSLYFTVDSSSAFLCINALFSSNDLLIKFFNSVVTFIFLFSFSC